MFGQKEYLKLLFCFLVLCQWVQCGKHHRRHMDHASLQMRPRANLRHNTKDYDQVTSAGGDSVESGDDAATHAPSGLDDDDTANGVQNDRGNDNDEVGDIQLIVAGKESVESGADAATLAPTGHDVDDNANDVQNDRGHDDNVDSIHNDRPKSKDYCWMIVHSASHFRNMDEIFETPSSTIDGYKTLVKSSNFDQEMLKKMLDTRSIAERTRQKFGDAAHMVPAGLNLGGYEMFRLPTSVLFFHRLKLRNDTRFSVDFLHNDLKEMTLKVHISLHDLHLAGDYERAISDAGMKNTLFYRPTSGQVDFLLKNVQYKMEGRYRLLHDQLHIEHVISEMSPEDVAIKYAADTTKEFVKLDKRAIKKYLTRIQNDLDSWLQDYFNDFLTFYGLGGATPDKKYMSYQNSRTIELNRFADQVLEAMRDRLRDRSLNAIVIPSFNLFALNGLQIKLTNGAVYGLESVHRQSAGTGRRSKGERRVTSHVTAVVGFSLLKVEYDYEIFATTGLPPLFGKLVLTANGQTARMDMVAINDSDTIDLMFRPLKEPPSQSLTVVGPANRIIANFKHLLEHQITAIMTNCLSLEIEKLGSIATCRKYIYLRHLQIAADQEYISG